MIISLFREVSATETSAIYQQQNHQPIRRIRNLNAARSSQPIPRIAPVPTQTVPPKEKNQKFSLSKDEQIALKDT
jgi:hypothetical protein